MLALVSTARSTQKKPTWRIQRKQSFRGRAEVELHGGSCVELEGNFRFSCFGAVMPRFRLGMRCASTVPVAFADGLVESVMADKL